ncbi:hypothetical protein evm_014693 [Chilo suppressalis]|nr:hypothetical protein evm_014693 [Chilo suppressalis]
MIFTQMQHQWTFAAIALLTLPKFLGADSHLDLPYYVPRIQDISSPLKIVMVLPSSAEEEIPSSSTSATTEMVPLAVPVPMQTAVQIAAPAVNPPFFCKNKPCPPCPPCLCAPSCTPSFFSYCSRCHQKCRCRSIEDAPEPLPLDPPEPLLGPVFALPALMPPPSFLSDAAVNNAIMPQNLFPWVRLG